MSTNKPTILAKHKGPRLPATPLGPKAAQFPLGTELNNPMTSALPLPLTPPQVAGETSRVFAAIPLPPEMQRTLVPVLAKLREQLTDARCVRADQAHVTLKFYGDVLENDINGLCAALRLDIAKIQCFSFDVQGAGAFPNLQSARVLWLGVSSGRGELNELATAVEHGSTAAGFATESREFRAHLTLARARGRDGIIRGVKEALAPLQNVVFGSVTVEKVVLYRSVLNKSGSVYSPLGVFPLAPP